MIPGAVPPTWKGGSIQRVDLATGAVTTLYTESSSGPLRAPNDLVFDGHGGFWFTDHGVRLDRTSDRTGIHYAKADGSSCEEVIFPLDAPNGIGLSPDGTRLYAAETHTGRVFWWDLSGPGRGGARQPGRPRRAPPRRPPRPPAARQPGRRRRGLGVRRHAGQRRHHRRSAPTARRSSTRPCPTPSSPTSASAAPTSAPPTPPSPAPAPSSPSTGPGPASASTTPADAVAVVAPLRDVACTSLGVGASADPGAQQVLEGWSAPVRRRRARRRATRPRCARRTAARRRGTADRRRG